ncbi:30S ribosomal protein S13 [Candidatus Bathyarchaeota archaeon]|nr:30S ribosomal protein S13 [Candidatus Bathyarchaeota archaeon]
MKEYQHIVRIAGTDIDGGKKIVYGLAKIKGIGVSFANAIVNMIKLNPNLKIGELTGEQVAQIEDVINNPAKHNIPAWFFNQRKELTTGKDMHLISSDLELKEKMNVELMKSIKCWKGVRHALGLKVRGQKTRTTGRKGIAVGVKKKALVARQAGGK